MARKEAFKRLKGGRNELNADLLDNTLLNWAHLLDASAKNRAVRRLSRASVVVAIEETTRRAPSASKAARCGASRCSSVSMSGSTMRTRWRRTISSSAGT